MSARNPWTACVGLTALLVASLAASGAHAQRSSYAASSRGSSSSFSGATGSRLPFSSSTTGAGGGLGAGAGSPFGAAGGSTAAGSPFGQGGMGAGGQSATTLGESGGQQFERGGFVGRDAEDVRGTFENLSGRDRRGAMMDMMVENYNEMRESRRRWRDQQNAPPPVRVRLEAAFDVPPRGDARSSEIVQERLNGLIASRGLAAAEVVISGRTAVLRGAVENPRDRALLDQLVRLEPGISQVDNQLSVVPAPAP